MIAHRCALRPIVTPTTNLLVSLTLLSAFVLGPRTGNASAAQNPLGLPVASSLPTTPEDVHRIQQSAERGDAQDEVILGFLYFGGLGGVPHDPAAALMWYRKASEKGSDSAAFFIGAMYDSGQGVSQDHAEAMKWFREAASRGSAVAQIRIGRAYEAGDGVARDFAQAFGWYREAAAQGNAVAENLIADMFSEGRGVAKDYTEAAVWYRMSADQGNGYGELKLAELYDNGLGVPQNSAEAVKYYRAEAEHGGPVAQFYIGVSYRDGRGGLTRDAAEAHKWFNIAAALAGENKIYAAARDELEKTMLAVDLAEARRRAHDWIEAFTSGVLPTPETERLKQALLAKVDGKRE